MRQIDLKTNRVYAQNLKPRDFDYCEPFILQGRPYIDETMDFIMDAKPGDAGELGEHLERQRSKPGRKTSPDDAEQAERARQLHNNGNGHSIRVIASEMGVGRRVVERWLKGCHRSVTDGDSDTVTA